MSKQWINVMVTEFGCTTVNTMPEDDIRVHFEGLDCHCVPLVRRHPNAVQVIHNSFDGREFGEEGEMQLTTGVRQ